MEGHGRDEFIGRRVRRGGQQGDCEGGGVEEQVLGGSGALDEEAVDSPGDVGEREN